MILEHRRQLLRGHIEAVGELPGFTRALEQTETELAQLGQSREQPPRGP